MIKDNNGLSCRYCLNKNVTALSSLTPTTTAKKTMFYGNPQCCEMALWGGVEIDVNDGYKFGEGLLTIRGEGRSAVHRAASLISEKRFDASLIHTHTFGFNDLPTALKYSKERIEDAIKVVVKIPG